VGFGALGSFTEVLMMAGCSRICGSITDVGGRKVMGSPSAVEILDERIPSQNSILPARGLRTLPIIALSKVTNQGVFAVLGV